MSKQSIRLTNSAVASALNNKADIELENSTRASVIESLANSSYELANSTYTLASNAHELASSTHELATSTSQLVTVFTNQVENELNEKFEKTGGTISGNTVVDGNLTVTGIINATITGSSDSAMSATKDSNGNVIVDTYATKSELNTTTKNFVDLSSAQTIAGVKTLTAIPQIKGGAPGIVLVNTDVTKGTNPSANEGWYIGCLEGSGTAAKNRLGLFQTAYSSTNGNVSTAMYAYKPTADVTTSASVQVIYPSSGNPYATAPTPDATSNTTHIATTAWVNSKITSTTAKAYITETYSSGSSWYRKYSDGWIEQGGFIAASSTMGAVSQTYHTPFTQAQCPILIGYSTDTGTDEVDAQHISAYSKTGFTAIRANRGSEAVGLQWYACGF